MSTAAPTTAPPTSVPPTTLAPTTVPPTTPPPVEWDFGPIELGTSLYAAFSSFPSAPTDPNLDTAYRIDPIEITMSVEGEPGWVGVEAGAIEVTLGMGEPSFDEGLALDFGPIELIIVPTFTDFLLDTKSCNWIKWSKIGSLDFEIDESNIAGRRPLDWKGCVYHVSQLGDKVGVYGANGVSLMKPSGVHYGMDTIYRIGLKNKGAFAGTKYTHWFVDLLGQLFQLDDKLTKLDYKEYFSTMSDIILSFDEEKNLLYICDGNTGYVYSPETKSLGTGPENVTGIGVQSNVLYVTSDGEIDVPKFEICTDIYDLGTRKPKTIQLIEVGSDLAEFLYASVDYRTSYKDNFRQIGWFLVNPDGRAHPKCYGVEFRFRLKSTIYEYFELDYLKVRGHIHGYSYLDMTS
jgi:hypothetical protein